MLGVGTKVNKYFIYAVILIVAFAFGRYSVKQNITQVTNETEKSKDTDKNVHTVIEIVKLPDGTEKTIKTIDSNTKTTEKSVTNSSTTSTPVKRSTLNISALAANDFDKHGILPVYGVSFNKELFGPVTVGAFGLTNKTIGLSIGVNF